MKTPVGKCTQCKKVAQWNTPGLDMDGNLYCNECINNDRSGIVFSSVNQFMEHGLYESTGGVVLNGVVVWRDLTTWVEGGSRSIRLTEEEKKLSPVEIAHLINMEHNVNGLWRCTGCGTKMTLDKVAGWPLFSGCCCASCMEGHKKKLNQERKNGHVCSMCGQPYGNCCC